MITRSAIFRGRIREGREEEFYALVAERMIPAWQGMRHAMAVRVYRPVEAEPGMEDVFLVQEIDYPSMEAVEEALAAPEREAAGRAMEAIRPLYEGFHHHVVYRPLTGDR